MPTKKPRLVMSDVVVICIVDGGRVRMPIATAQKMNVLAALIEDCGAAEGEAAEVPIDNVNITSTTMQTIVGVLSSLDGDLKEANLATLEQVLLAANFIDAPSVLELACTRLGEMVNAAAARRPADPFEEVFGGLGAEPPSADAEPPVELSDLRKAVSSIYALEPALCAKIRSAILGPAANNPFQALVDETGVATKQVLAVENAGGVVETKASVCGSCRNATTTIVGVNGFNTDLVPMVAELLSTTFSTGGMTKTVVSNRASTEVVVLPDLRQKEGFKTRLITGVVTEVHPSHTSRSRWGGQPGHDSMDCYEHGDEATSSVKVAIKGVLTVHTDDGTDESSTQTPSKVGFTATLHCNGRDCDDSLCGCPAGCGYGEGQCRARAGREYSFKLTFEVEFNDDDDDGGGSGGGGPTSSGVLTPEEKKVFRSYFAPNHEQPDDWDYDGDDYFEESDPTWFTVETASPILSALIGGCNELWTDGWTTNLCTPQEVAALAAEHAPAEAGARDNILFNWG